jgi:hypothetical protein
VTSTLSERTNDAHNCLLFRCCCCCNCRTTVDHHKLISVFFLSYFSFSLICKGALEFG